MAQKKQSGTEKSNGQQSLPLKPERMKKLDVSALENWLWEAACAIRGPLDAPKFKDYILPLIFLKRLSDVFDDEVAHLAYDFGDVKTAAKLVEQDHKLVRFYIPQKARWSFIVEKSTGLGELLTDAVRAIARENPRLSGVIDVTDFNATAAGQRMVDDGRLAALVQVLNNPDYRLGLDDVEPDMIGRAYEYLLRKFAEGQGQSAGEFYTPREVAVLMAIILDPQPGMTVDDPCCGSAGLLIKCHLQATGNEGKEDERAAEPSVERGSAPAVRPGDQLVHVRHGPDERLPARYGGRDRPGRHHAPARLHRGGRPAPTVRPGDGQSHVEPEIPRRDLRERPP